MVAVAETEHEAAAEGKTRQYRLNSLMGSHGEGRGKDGVPEAAPTTARAGRTYRNMDMVVEEKINCRSTC